MEPFVHALIPLAFLLALFPNVDKKYVFTLLPIVWIIDLDSFIGIHRYTFHNLTFVLIVAVIAYLLWKNRTAFWVALYYGLSHLILDLSKPGPAWLYPFVQKTFYLDVSIQKGATWMFNFTTGSLSIDQYNTLFGSLPVKTYIGEVSVLFLLLFTILLGSYFIVKYKKKSRK